ncbi:MAG: hypothetical protein QM642_07565 [Edaphocola sp.]
MANVKVYKKTGVPTVWEADAVYYVYTGTETLCYVTDMYGSPRQVGVGQNHTGTAIGTSISNLADYSGHASVTYDGNPAKGFLSFRSSVDGIGAGIESGRESSGNWNTYLAFLVNGQTGGSTTALQEKMRLTSDGTLYINGATAATQSWVNAQGYLTSAAIPTVNDAALTISTSGIATGTAAFTANQATDVDLDINVPGTDLDGTVDNSGMLDIASSTGTAASIDLKTYVESGTYTPAVSAASGYNVYAEKLKWTRIGDVVHVSGLVAIDYGGSNFTTVQAYLELPVASTFSADNDLTGVASPMEGGVLSMAYMVGETSYGQAALNIATTSSVTNLSVMVSFDYIIH